MVKELLDKGSENLNIEELKKLLEKLREFKAEMKAEICLEINDMLILTLREAFREGEL